MSDKLNVAIVGATGAVGEAFLKILAEREFPIENLYALASERSEGKTVVYRNRTYSVERADIFDYNKVDLVLMSAGGSTSKELAPKITAKGVTVIDNSSAFRYDDDIPLVVPEVNFDAIKPNDKLIANPNCSTIQMVVALKPIYDLCGIKRINVATYQAVSGAGSKAVKELAEQNTHLLNGKPIEPNAFKKQIAFNVIPEIDVVEENGYTREEMKMHWETQKILGDNTLSVNATAVRVPVFYGHSEAVHIETTEPYELEAVIAALKSAEGVEFIGEGEFPTAFHDANDTDPVYVGRVRRDHSLENGLNLWVVADNIRKGAALNAIQIAERLFL